MKLIKSEGDLRQYMKAALIQADVFFWWAEYGYGGTAGAPDMNVFAKAKRSGRRRLIPTELKMGDLLSNGKVKLHKVTPGQVDWHTKAYGAKMPAALVACVNDGEHQHIMITRGVDLIGHRTGIDVSGLLWPARQLNGMQVTNELYTQGLRQAR